LKNLICRDDRICALNLTIPDLSKESDVFSVRVWWALEEVSTFEEEKGTFLRRMWIFTLNSVMFQKSRILGINTVEFSSLEKFFSIRL
jgi:hypothetical protein